MYPSNCDNRVRLRLPEIPLKTKGFSVFAHRITYLNASTTKNKPSLLVVVSRVSKVHVWVFRRAQTWLTSYLAYTPRITISNTYEPELLINAVTGLELPQKCVTETYERGTSAYLRELLIYLSGLRIEVEPVAWVVWNMLFRHAVTRKRLRFHTERASKDKPLRGGATKINLRTTPSPRKCTTLDQVMPRNPIVGLAGIWWPLGIAYGTVLFFMCSCRHSWLSAAFSHSL